MKLFAFVATLFWINISYGFWEVSQSPDYQKAISSFQASYFENNLNNAVLTASIRQDVDNIRMSDLLSLEVDDNMKYLLGWTYFREKNAKDIRIGEYSLFLDEFKDFTIPLLEELHNDALMSIRLNENNSRTDVEYFIETFRPDLYKDFTAYKKLYGSTGVLGFVREEEMFNFFSQQMWRNVYPDLSTIQQIRNQEQKNILLARHYLYLENSKYQKYLNELDDLTIAQDSGLMYDLLLFLWNDKNYEAAIKLIPLIPTDYRNSKKWWGLKSKIAYDVMRGVIELDKNGYNDVYDMLTLHKTNIFGHVEEFEQNYISGLLQLFFLKNYDKASKLFHMAYLNAKFAFSKSAAAYWAGMSYLYNKNQSRYKVFMEASSFYVNTFYGEIATMRLGGVSNIKDVMFQKDQKTPDLFHNHIAQKRNLTINKAFAVEALTNANENVNFLTAATMVSLGMNNYASYFLKSYIKSSSNISTLKVAFDMFKDFVPREDLYGIERLLQFKGFSTREHYKVLKSVSTSPESVHAIIKQESAFNPNARSSSGAIGLMQLLPSTAKYVAKLKRIPYSNSRLKRSPKLNVNLGTAYFERLSKKFGNNLALTYGAYNGGPTNIRRWLSRLEFPDTLENQLLWIELVPFSETRKYIMYVCSNTVMYDYILKHPA